jgi:hypothetical protein
MSEDREIYDVILSAMRTPAEVARYLSSRGYKIKKSAIYNHVWKGWLAKDPSGLYTVAEVEKYAKLHLHKSPPVKPVASPATEIGTIVLDVVKIFESDREDLKRELKIIIALMLERANADSYKSHDELVSKISILENKMAGLEEKKINAENGVKDPIGPDTMLEEE